MDSGLKSTRGPKSPTLRVREVVSVIGIAIQEPHSPKLAPLTI